MKLMEAGWSDELDENKVPWSASAGDDEFGDGYEGGSAYDDEEEEEEVVVAVTSDDDDIEASDEADDLLEPEPVVEEAVIVAGLPEPGRGYQPARSLSRPAKSAPKPLQKKATKKSAAKK